MPTMLISIQGLKAAYEINVSFVISLCKSFFWSLEQSVEFYSNFYDLGTFLKSKIVFQFKKMKHVQ